MVRVAVCQKANEKGGVQKGWIEQLGLEKDLVSQVHYFGTADDLLDDIKEKGPYNIVIIDTDINDAGGVDLAKKIKKLCAHFVLIFTSDKKRCDSDVINIHPFFCLYKPIEQEMLFEALGEVGEREGYFSRIFSFSFQGITRIICLSDVMFFNSDRRLVRIRMKDGNQYEFYDKLGEVEKRLKRCSPSFYRANQSYLVNVRHVSEYCNRYVVMNNGEQISHSPGCVFPADLLRIL